MKLAEKFERGMALLHSSVADKSDLLEENVLFLTSSDPAGSTLLASSQDKQETADEGEEEEMMEPSQPTCV